MTGIDSGHIIDISSDTTIDVTDLRKEFRIFPSVMFSHCQAKADAQEVYDLLKCSLKELESEVYVELKSKPDKITEKHAESLVDLDSRVKQARREVISASRDLETLKNSVKSLDCKKDMLIQLGADARKETY